MGGNKLKLKVRMAIIPELSKQNYDTVSKQFREVVANSFDASAKEVRIDVRNVGVGTNAQTQLVFLDDGYGMTEEELNEDYLSVGGSWKINDPNTIGRIGIGSLAVAVLSKTVRLETRKKDTDQVVVVDLWISDAVRNLDRTAEVQEIDVGEVVNLRPATNEDPLHFTQLTLYDVSVETARLLNDKDRFSRVIEELRRILPLQYPEEHPLLTKMQADLREILLDQDRLKTIKVLVQAPCLGQGYISLERYAYGHQSREDEQIAGYPYPILPQIIPGGVNQSLTIFGYFVDAGKQLPKERQGLVVRVRNMGVDLNSFFDLGDSAANLRTTGELFIEGLDERNAMTINRNALVKEHADYTAIQKQVGIYLNVFQKEVRGRVDINSLIKKQVDKAKGVREAFVSVGEALGEANLTFETGDANILANAPDVDVVGEIKEIDDSIVVYPLGFLTKTHDVKHIDDEVEVSINEEILEHSITIGNEDFYYYLKKGQPTEPPCEINVNDKEIYLNVGHPILESRGDQIIRAVVALRCAYLKANGDADMLYELTLQILGNAFKR